MEMNVENLLSSGLAIGQEQVDAFAMNTTGSNRSHQTMPDLQEVARYDFIEIRQLSSVNKGNDQQVPGVHWLDVHKRSAPFVTEYK